MFGNWAKTSSNKRKKALAETATWKRAFVYFELMIDKALISLNYLSLYRID
jgi:hypothetical protein